ncbi:M28 family peptidase [Mesonia sp. K7]|uniref:M28 family peptidase n=1 Tax=Mesonia sp. K7 TaxID=2218606 RepID=UPI000DA79AFF|nr:M28 family peptidase [Mesonia sp. K7]PZD78464.1 peptidase M28 [Mesonia sp. K7]
MKSILKDIIAVVSIGLLVCFSFYTLLPSKDYFDKKERKFSVENAFRHVETISQKPHSIGTAAHSKVRNYIVQELQKLDLEVQTQKDYYLSHEGLATVPENIITKIPGKNPKKPALLVMTHYDSAVHSSFGASDAASGVAIILENLRLLLEDGFQPENDVIICFTDAEEIGLLGAGLFVKQHPWSKNIGLVLNFEARGSGGPSNTILETNTGNKKLIHAFAEANPQFPLATSLMYSVYKVLPNDTDATIFREVNDTPSFFFAFIDDHFDYHTAYDTAKNLDKQSLIHQATYLKALLPYFAHQDLSELKSENDVVYFNFPFLGMLSFPFFLIFPLLTIGWLLWLGVLMVALRKQKFTISQVLKGLWFLVKILFISIASVNLLFFYISNFYPVFLENQNGFTPNGHWYILASVCITLLVSLFFTSKIQSQLSSVKDAYFMAILFFWMLILTLIAFVLPGAFYFVIPVYLALVGFLVVLKSYKCHFIQILLAIPAILIFAPLIQFFPVGLGLKMLSISALFTILLFGLLWNVFVEIKFNKILAILCTIIAFVALIIAHTKAGLSIENPKQNSLVYLYDADTNQASWNSYDYDLDHWNQAYFKEEIEVDSTKNVFDSKYNSEFTYSAKAQKYDIPLSEFYYKNKGNGSYELKIAPQRELNRIELFVDKNINFESFTLNGKEQPEGYEPFYQNRKNNKLLTYYPIDRDTLRIEFSAQKKPVFTMYESSHNLMNNKWVKILPRDSTMIPRPFVLNDAIMVKQVIK